MRLVSVSVVDAPSGWDIGELSYDVCVCVEIGYVYLAWEGNLVEEGGKEELRR